MVKEEIRILLMECESINEYTALCKKNNIKPEELDAELLKHFGSLGNGGSAYNHSDPRKAFK